MRNRKLARLEGNPPSQVNFSLYNILARLPPSRRDNRDFNIQRRGRQRERQNNNRFYKQNNNFVRASRFFVHFFARFCKTTTRKCLISRFMEDISKQRRNFISLFELGYGPLKFSFRRVRLQLTK